VLVSKTSSPTWDRAQLEGHSIGKILKTITTEPLPVMHWISSGTFTQSAPATGIAKTENVVVFVPLGVAATPRFTQLYGNGIFFDPHRPYHFQIVFYDLQLQFLTKPRFLTIGPNSLVWPTDSELRCAVHHQ
jgi:hypothetical protein